MNPEMERRWDRDTRHFQKRLAIVSKTKTQKYMKQLKAMIADDGVFDLQFVRDTGNGHKQKSDATCIKWEWVDQYENGGYSGDSFAGYVYIQIKLNRFLRMQYAM